MNALALPPDLASRVRRDEQMAKHTSWHVGVPADLFFRPLDADVLGAFLRSLAPDTPVLWIGLGSNLLVRDGGIRGAVIETHGVFDDLERLGETEIRCGSGVACAKLAKQCIRWGLGPAEFFAGIPGTLGGALAMNAGAFGGETWRHVLGVTTIDRAGVQRERPASDYVASYRHVSGPANEWFLGARLTFELCPGVSNEDIRLLLARVRDGDVVITMGAGSIGHLAPELAVPPGAPLTAVSGQD
jgi:UDP-N-acetylmuramate dehydrogenase